MTLAARFVVVEWLAAGDDEVEGLVPPKHPPIPACRLCPPMTHLAD